MDQIDQEEKKRAPGADPGFCSRSPANCPYCLRVDGVGDLPTSQRQVPTPFDRVLWSNQYVVLVPTLGMITPGYFLVINRRHLMNFSFLPDHELEALEDSFRYLATRLSQVFGEYFFFEHGPNGTDCQGGGCISHAHAHLIPLANKMGSNLLQQFKWEQLSALPDLRDDRGDGYMLLGLHERFYVTIAPSVQSQWVRRRLAATLHGPRHWNWKIDPGNAELDSTLQQLSNVELVDPRRQYSRLG
jgi:diadenosine tetraphosphate (Ap4A) HIT family hydrolase